MRLVPTQHTVFYSRLAACLLALFFATVQASTAQKPTKLRGLANEAAEKGDWAGAYSYLQAAYAIDSSSFEVRDALALAAFEIGDFETAVKLFQVNYDKDKGQLRPDALFYLAAAQKRLGEYENAQRNFKTYLKKYKTKGQKYLVERAEHEMKSAQWALENKLYSEVLPTAEALDERLHSFVSELSSYNPLALSSIKKVLWEGTENWEELLYERAAISGKLVLSEATKIALQKFKK